MHRGIRNVGKSNLLEIALVAEHLLAVDGPVGFLPDGALLVFRLVRQNCGWKLVLDHLEAAEAS
jgi:hypothetical protein